MARSTGDLYVQTDAFGVLDKLYIVADVQAPTDGDDALFFELDIDDAAGTMAYGTGILSQVVEMQVYRDGERVPSTSLLSVSVSRNAEEMLQRWSFEISLPGGGGISEVNPISLRAPSLSMQSIDIYGVYLAAGNIYQKALIAGGIVDSEDRNWTSNGVRASFSGVDKAGRYDGETFDLILKPGHGINRARVAWMIAASIGFPTAFISLEDDGVAMMKEFQAADANGFPLIQELADVENRKVMINRDGELVWVKMGDPRAENVKFTFDTRHVVEGSVRIQQAGDVVTRVEAKGDEQLPSACGDISTTRTNSTFSLDFPITLPWRQDTGDAFTSMTVPTNPTEPILTRYEIFDRVERCGVLIYERTRVYEYFNPQTERYEWNDGTYVWETLGSVYVNDDVIDAEPAYAYLRDAWLLVSDDEVWHYWNTSEHRAGPGFPEQQPNITGGSTLYGNFYYPIGTEGLPNQDNSPFEGVKIGTFRRSKRYYAPKEHVKERDLTGPPPFETWEETTPADNLRVLGSGEAITGTSEELRIVSEEETFFEVDESGYQHGTVTHRYGYAKNTGSQYLYGDNSLSSSGSEYYRYIGSTYETLTAQGESSHDRLVEQLDQDGQSIGSILETGLEGYLPAADRIPDSGPSEPVEDVFLQEEIDAAYQRALRTDSKSIAVTVIDESLEDNHPSRTVHLQAPYAENIEELERMAWAVIDQSAAAKVDFQLAGANFYIEPGDNVRLTLTPLGIDHELRVVSVSWTFGSGAIVTDVHGEIYVR